jgi:hypothetical protein
MEFDLSGIQACDFSRATMLCEIMGRYGSDKGNSTNTGHHNYTIVYDKLFAPMKNAPMRVFELGLGTNNTDVPSNMGINGKPGASLRGWREYFPNAQIFGADIDRRVLFQEDRIATFYCDQMSASSIAELWNNDVLRDKFDIIIEDGLHTYNANVSFFENSFHMVKPGGIYVIEDVIHRTIPLYQNKILQWESIHPGLKGGILVLPHAINRVDNCLIVFVKGA